MIRANVSEDREAIKGRFLNGLNRDIVNMVELQYYLKIEYRVHVAIKVKKQFKKKVEQDQTAIWNLLEVGSRISGERGMHKQS